MTRTSTYTILLGLMSILSMQQATAMEKLKEHVEITFNNHPDDTQIKITGILPTGKLVEIMIIPNRKNITINRVREVEVQKMDGLLIRLLTLKYLQNVSTITVTKDAKSGKHNVSAT